MPDVLTTGDGLSIGYDSSTGRIDDVRLDGRRAQPGGGRMGFCAHDVGAWSDLCGFENGRCAPLDLSLDVDLEAGDSAIRVSGCVADTSGRDRAITLNVAVPVDAAGWTWHDDPRRSRPIRRGEIYRNEIDVGAGLTGRMSLYPFACVTNGDDGLAIGLDMDCPAICRLSYDGPAGRLVLSYDFGLSAETAAFPSGAPFRFVIFRVAGRWGFRAAADAYYRLFERHFTCRSKDQGIWMPFGDVGGVQGWEDFGFRYHEGTGNMAFDNAHDVLPFRYTEPCTFWMSMDSSIPRTHENVMAELQRWVDSNDPAKRRQAAAVFAAGSADATGRLQYRVWTRPWCDGVVFSMNPNPHLPGDNEAGLYWNESIGRELYGPDVAEPQAGEYLDSLEAYATECENFRRDHFAHVTAPLTFSTSQRRPVIHKSQSIWEYVRTIAADLHGMGKLLFANDAPNRYAFLAPHLDVMGMEVGWIDDEGLWRPPADDWMLFKRVMCRHRPFLFLLNARFERCTPTAMDAFFRRCLFYGMFPGMFSFDACNASYWGRPDMYTRDRPLFKTYLPLIKRVAEAGWEPITHARCDDETVYVERFGPDGDGNVYLTLLNGSDGPCEMALRVAVGACGLGDRCTAVDGLTGQPVPTRHDGTDAVVDLVMQPQEVRALQWRVE